MEVDGEHAHGTQDAVHFLSLPSELKHHVFNHLPPQELYTSTQTVCKDWRSVLTSSTFCNHYANLLHAEVTRVRDALSAADEELLFIMLFSELEAPFKEAVKQLGYVLKNCPKAIRMFLGKLADPKHAPEWKYFLLEICDQDIRNRWAKFMLFMFRTLCAYDDTLVKEKPLEQPSSAEFFSHFLASSEETRVHWKTFHEYWFVLKEYAVLGPRERRFLVQKDTILTLLDYYMGVYSPYWNQKDNSRVFIGSKTEAPNLVYFMESLSNVVRGTSMDPSFRNETTVSVGGVLTEPKSRPPTCFPDELAELTPISMKSHNILFDRLFFISLLKQAYNGKTNAHIVTHLSWCDRDISQWILTIIMENFYRCRNDQLGNLIDALENIISISDNLQAWRCKLALNYEKHGFLFVMQDAFHKDPMVFVHGTRLISKLLRKYPIAATVLHRMKNNIRWLEERLLQATLNQSWANGLGVQNAKAEFADLYYEMAYFFDDGDAMVDSQEEAKPNTVEVEMRPVEDTSTQTSDAPDGEKRGGTAVPMSVEDGTQGGPEGGFTLFGTEPAAAPEGVPTDWACEACTYINVALLDTCEVCGSPKPASLAELLSANDMKNRAQEKAKRKDKWEGPGNEMLPLGTWDEEEEKSWDLLPPKYTSLDWSPLEEPPAAEKNEAPPQNPPPFQAGVALQDLPPLTQEDAGGVGEGPD